MQASVIWPAVAVNRMSRAAGVLHVDLDPGNRLLSGCLEGAGAWVPGASNAVKHSRYFPRLHVAALMLAVALLHDTPSYAVWVGPKGVGLGPDSNRRPLAC